MKRSFARAGEDVKLEELVGDVRWFVDIGANDGYRLKHILLRP